MLTWTIPQDEQKRVESDERASREELSDRADDIFQLLHRDLTKRETPLPQKPQSIESDKQ